MRRVRPQRGKTLGGEKYFMSGIEEFWAARGWTTENETMNEVVVKPSELVAQYIQLRDAKDAATQKYKDFCALHFGGPMEEIESKLLKLFNELGVDNLNARGIGTAYRLTQVSVTIADPREFRRHVIGNEAWDLADWRASKTAINDLIEKGEPLPPGINRVARYTIGIRRS